MACAAGVLRSAVSILNWGYSSFSVILLIFFLIISSVTAHSSIIIIVKVYSDNYDKIRRDCVRMKWERMTSPQSITSINCNRRVLFLFASKFETRISAKSSGGKYFWLRSNCANINQCYVSRIGWGQVSCNHAIFMNQLNNLIRSVLYDDDDDDVFVCVHQCLLFCVRAMCQCMRCIKFILCKQTD